MQERSKAEKRNRKLRQQLADYRVPEVMEYVSEKADLYEIQKKVKSWERKVEIADVSEFSDSTLLCVVVEVSYIINLIYRNTVNHFTFV